jgi:hypothetical protein
MRPLASPDREVTEGHETAVVDRVDAAVAAAVIGLAWAGLTATDTEAIAPVILASIGGFELARRTNAEHLRLHRARGKLRSLLGPS